MRTALTVVTTSLALLTAVVPLVAHHSFVAEFDDKQVVNIEGTVTKMEWVNPHAWIHLDVKNKDGSLPPWMVEANTPNGLLRRGFTKKSLEVGRCSSLTDIGRVAAKQSQRQYGDVQDGKRLFLGSSRGEEPNKEQ